MASSPSSKPRRKEQTVDKESKLTAKDKSSSLVVFAHGAGAPSTSDWMIRYAWWKRRAPPKAEKLVDFHSDIVKNAVSKYPGHPLILAGKSIGSRLVHMDRMAWGLGLGMRFGCVMAQLAVPVQLTRILTLLMNLVLATAQMLFMAPFV